MKRGKRFLAFALATLMAFQLMPSRTWAAEADDAAGEVAEAAEEVADAAGEVAEAAEEQYTVTVNDVDPKSIQDLLSQYPTIYGTGNIKIHVHQEWELFTVTGSYGPNNTIHFDEKIEPFTKDLKTQEFDCAVGYALRPKSSYTFEGGPDYLTIFESATGDTWVAEDLGNGYHPLDRFNVTNAVYRKELGAPDSEYYLIGSNYNPDDPYYDQDYFRWTDGTYSFSGHYWKAGDYLVISYIQIMSDETLSKYQFILDNQVNGFTIQKGDLGKTSKYENQAEADGSWTPKEDPDATTPKATLVNPYPGVEMGVLGLKTFGGYEDEYVLSSYFTLPHGAYVDESKTIYAQTNREGYSITTEFNHTEYSSSHPRNLYSYAPYDVFDLYYLNVKLPAFRTDEAMVCYLYVNGGENLEDKVLAVVAYANEYQNYSFTGYAGENYTGNPVALNLKNVLSPYYGYETIKWYYNEDGIRGDEVEGCSVVTDEFGESWAYGPTDVGRYEFVVECVGVEMLSVEFEISEPYYFGEHSYVLTGELDKEYDGEPVEFDPDKMLSIDKGMTSWGMLEKNGEARYIWRQFTGDKMNPWIELDGAPVAVGSYELVIQENGKMGWTDVASFEVNITGTAFVDEVIITKEPENWYGKYGKKASFSVEATGMNLSYQWQYQKGGTWYDYTVATADTANFKVTMNEKNVKWPIRCVVTSELGTEAITKTVRMRLEGTGPILIIKQPVDWYGVYGKKASFTVQADGEDLTYQWQYQKGSTWKNYEVATANAATFKVTMNEKNEKWAIRCLITDGEGHQTTTDTVYVKQKSTQPTPEHPIVITTQPVDWHGTYGKKASFTVAANGSGLTYEWQYQKGGVWNTYALEGYDTPNFKVTMNEKNVKWALRCVIRDANGNELTTNEVHMIKD